MTWSTGFFRLWVVVTILWMVTTFAAIGMDDFRGLWSPHATFEVVYKGDVKDTLDSAHDPEFLRSQIVTGVKKGAALLERTNPAEAKSQIDRASGSADELLKALADENGRRASRLYHAVLILLVPPIVLLIFGVTIAWVAAGFWKVTGRAGR